MMWERTRVKHGGQTIWLDDTGIATLAVEQAGTLHWVLIPLDDLKVLVGEFFARVEQVQAEDATLEAV
jgi:hypothetical protein